MVFVRAVWLVAGGWWLVLHASCCMLHHASMPVGGAT